MNHNRKEQPVPNSILAQVNGGERSVAQQHGAQSMAGALSLGIGMAKGIMAVLVVLFLLSNLYWVPEGYIAVQSRWGRLSGNAGTTVRGPGGPYLAAPPPVGRVLRIPTTAQTVPVNKAFMFEGPETDGVRKRTHAPGAFRPGLEGSLITGDRNIVQGTWMVHYRIDYLPQTPGQTEGALRFVRNVGTVERAGEIVLQATEAAIVAVVAGIPVADFVAGRIDAFHVKSLVQQTVDSLGLVITNISTSGYQVPRVVAPAFQAVNSAESEKALDMEKAVRYRVSKLSEAAGNDWELLLKLIDRYEDTVKHQQKARIDSILNKIEELLLSGSVGGFAAQTLSMARTDKTRTIERARAHAARFVKLGSSNDQAPEVLRNELLQDALTRILSDRSVTTHMVPSGCLYLPVKR
jgi:regulator of protease activity HflC (stomatin/prohibitin superfamily)